MRDFTTIRITYKGTNLFDEMNFASREEYKNSLEYQKKLSQYYKNADCVCLCNQLENLRISIKIVNGKYIFSAFPRTAELHNEGCPFHSNYDKLITSNGKYKSEIFKETFASSHQKGESTLEGSKKKTFNRFCGDMIAATNSFAFNKKNKGCTAINELKNQNDYDFINDFFGTLDSTYLLDKPINQMLPPGTKLVFGVSFNNEIYTVLKEKKRFTKSNFLLLKNSLKIINLKGI